MTVSLIAAMSQNRVIGQNGQLPWHIPADLKRFKELTSGHPIIMGRKTFEALGKPLPKRRNVVVTHQKDFDARGATVVDSVEKALRIFESSSDEVFIIGGGEIYSQTLNRADRIYLTVIHQDFDGDAFFPEFDDSKFKIFNRQNFSDPLPFSFIDYKRYAVTS